MRLCVDRYSAGGFGCLFLDSTAAAIMMVPNRMMIVRQMMSVIITPVLTLAVLVLVVGWCRIRVVAPPAAVPDARGPVVRPGRYRLAV